MKAIVIILLIIAAIFVYLKFGSDSQKKATPSTAPQTAAPAPQTQPRPTSTVTEEVNSVINYGIGATQLKAKQRATTKINDASKKNNRDLEEALK